MASQPSTSKTLAKVRPRISTPRAKVKLADVNPNLVCVLCGGYFVEATTIIECVHSFCKTCLVRYLETSKYCPICDVQVHKTEPLLNIRPDPTLQELVYKLVPGLFTSEIGKRRDFFKLNPDEIPAAPIGLDKRKDHQVYIQEENISVALEFSPDGKVVRDKDGKRKKRLDKDNKDAQGTLKRFLYCPAAFTVGHVKKFVRMKFSLADTYTIDVFHSDAPLNDRYTLLDIAYIYAWRRKRPLKLFYTVYDESGPSPAKRRKFVLCNNEIPAQNKPKDIVAKPPKDLNGKSKELKSKEQSNKLKEYNRFKESAKLRENSNKPKNVGQKTKDIAKISKDTLKSKDLTKPKDVAKLKEPIRPPAELIKSERSTPKVSPITIKIPSPESKSTGSTNETGTNKPLKAGVSPRGAENSGVQGKSEPNRSNASPRSSEAANAEKRKGEKRKSPTQTSPTVMESRHVEPLKLVLSALPSNGRKSKSPRNSTSPKNDTSPMYQVSPKYLVSPKYQISPSNEATTKEEKEKKKEKSKASTFVNNCPEEISPGSVKAEVSSKESDSKGSETPATPVNMSPPKKETKKDSNGRLDSIITKITASHASAVSCLSSISSNSLSTPARPLHAMTSSSNSLSSPQPSLAVPARTSSIIDTPVTTKARPVATHHMPQSIAAYPRGSGSLVPVRRTSAGSDSRGSISLSPRPAHTSDPRSLSMGFGKRSSLPATARTSPTDAFPPVGSRRPRSEPIMHHPRRYGESALTSPMAEARHPLHLPWSSSPVSAAPQHLTPPAAMPPEQDAPLDLHTPKSVNVGH